MTGSKGVASETAGSWAAHLMAVVVAVAVMWLLHAGDHGTAIVLLVGAGVYAGVMGGYFLLATRRARRRAEIERANFAAYMDEKNRRFYGR